MCKILLSISILIPVISIFFVFTKFFKDNKELLEKFIKTVFSIQFLNAFTFFIFCVLKPIREELFFGHWIEPFGFDFIFETNFIQGILILFVTGTMLLALFLEKKQINRTKFFYSLYLFIQISFLILIFSNDIFLTVMFFQLTIIPIWFLTTQWGGKLQKGEGKKTTLFNYFASLLFLTGILYLHYFNFAITNIMTGSFIKLNIAEPLFPLGLQLFILLMIIIGLFIPSVSLTIFYRNHDLFKIYLLRAIYSVSILVNFYLLFKFVFLFPDILRFLVGEGHGIF